MKLQFLLYVVILGLVINLLANMIWKYLPGTNRHIDKIVTAALVGICIILLVFHQEDSSVDAPQQNIEIGAHATGVHSNIGGTQIIATHSNVKVGPTGNDLSSTTCMIEAKVRSDVVSRVFFRNAFRPEGGQQTLQPTSQELFYEWQIVLSANETAQDIALELHQLQADDRIAIDPATGVLSEPAKRWYSGFPEPHRSKPDYLLRTVRFSHLAPHISAAAVTIRRHLAKPLLSSNDLIKIENVTASTCQIRLEEVGQAQDVERLQRFAKTLAEHVYRMSETGSPVPLRSDPGDLAEHEIQGAIELRCKNEPCSEMKVGRFEAHVGKSPGEYAKERRTQKLSQLKEALGEFFPCIKGPYDDTHPTRETQIIEMCGEPKPMSPAEVQRMLSVMEKHGFKTYIMQPSKPN